MITLDELSQKYKGDLVDKLGGLESLRKKIMFSDLLVLILAVVPMVYVVVTVMSMEKNAPVGEVAKPFIVLAVMVAVAIAVKVMGSPNRSMFREQYRGLVIAALNPDWHYEPKGCITEQEYVDAEIFQHKPYKYSGCDLITGNLDGIQFKAAKFIDTASYNRGGKKYASAQGFLLTSDTGNALQGKTFIDINTANLLLGGLGEGFLGRNVGQRVTVGNAEFDKHFAVCSTNPNEAQRILSQSMVDALLQFREQTHYIYPIMVSFIGSRVSCAIVFDQDPFVPGVFDSVLDYKRIELWHSIFSLHRAILASVCK